MATLGAAIVERDRASLVLAGGSTPRELYRRLTELPWRERVGWRAVEIFWGDERCVAADDPASNFRMANETLLARLEEFGIEPAAVHRIPAERGGEEAARAYDEVVREAAGDPPRFDLVLLGMGGDGHTASLFPDTPEPDGGGRLAIVTRASVEPHERVSLTLRALNGADTAIFLVAGEDKAEAVARVFGARPGYVAPRAGFAGEPPAAWVRPRRRLVWMLDRAAAARLPVAVPAVIPTAGGGR